MLPKNEWKRRFFLTFPEDEKGEFLRNCWCLMVRPSTWNTIKFMVLILDSYSEIGAHVRSNLCFKICFRHLIDREQSPKRPFFIHACAKCSELPYHVSTMIKFDFTPNYGPILTFKLGQRYKKNFYPFPLFSPEVNKTRKTRWSNINAFFFTQIVLEGGGGKISQLSKSSITQWMHIVNSNFSFY